jgi:hypothetical protein
MFDDTDLDSLRLTMRERIGRPSLIARLPRILIALLVVASFGLAMGVSTAHGQVEFESRFGTTGCDTPQTQFWTTSDCWEITSGGAGENENGYPDAANENVTIVEDDFPTIFGNTFTGDGNIGSLTVENTDDTVDDTGLNIYVGDGDVLTVNGTLSNKGNLSLDGSNASEVGDLTVTGSSTIDGNVTVGVSTFESQNFLNIKSTGSVSAQTGGLVETTSGGNITINGTLTATGNANVTADGNLSINSNGELSMSSGTIKVRGDLSNSGKFSSGSSEVIFAGNASAGSGDFQGISGDFSSSDAINTNDNSFNNLTINSGTRVNPDDGLTDASTSGEPVEVTGTLTVNGVYGTQESNKGVEQSELVFTGSTFEILSSDSFFAAKVTFIGGNTTSVQGTVFSEVKVTGGTTLSLQNKFTINDKLTLDSGDFISLTNRLVLNDDAVLLGTVTPNGGGITFNSGGTQSIDGQSGADTKLGNAIVANDQGNTTVTFESTGASVITKDLTLQSGTTLNLGRRLEIKGDFTNTGGEFTFIDKATEETIALTGGSDQTIDSSSNITLATLEIANERDQVQTPPDIVVKNNSLISVSGQLIMTSGRLKTNGDLTLEPGARIIYNSPDDDGDGKLDSYITDVIDVERSLRGSSGWFFLAPSVTTTYDEFLDEDKAGVNDLWTQGPDGSDVPTAPFDDTNLFYYDESASGSQNTGWTTIGEESADGQLFNGGGSLTSTIPSGLGLLLYPFSNDDRSGDPEGFPKTIDAVGPASFQTSISPTVKATNTDTDDDYTDGDGWNLIGNPYLNVIDWDELGKTGLGGTVYIYDAGNTAYLSYNGSPDPELEKDFEAFGHIAPQQAFFVNATVASPSLTIDITNDQVPASETSDDPFLPKSGMQQDRTFSVQTALVDTEVSSYTRATFRADGELGPDDHDGLQLKAPANGLGDTAILELYSVRDDGTGLSINNLPYNIEEEVVIPLEPKLRGCDGANPFVGEAEISLNTARNIPGDWGLVLEDTKTGDQYDLRGGAQEEYTYTLKSSTPADDCAAAASKSKTQRIPAVPSPEVQTHSVSKNGSGPNTRFQLRIVPNATIPVEFTSFTGSVADNAAKLEWTTATEQNNAGFQVQRKVDGSFQNIDGAFVEGAGTSEEPQSYSYRVEDLDAGQHTFRLKQVDVDGGSSFSKETTVKVGLDSQYELKAYPNPISEQATIKFAVKESQDVTLELYNTLGQRVQVLHQGSVPSSQTRTVSLQASDLSSGLYIVRMRGESFSTTKSVTVVR